MASDCLRPEEPNPPLPESRPMRSIPRRLMSSNTRAAAMRSVCGVLKIQLRVGSIGATEPERLMKGISPRFISGITAMVLPVSPPMTTSTWSALISRLAKVRALAALPPVS